MQRYLVRRILLALVTLLAVSLIIFVMSRAAGDPRHVYLDDYSTQEDWDRLTATLGLDKPYYQQYGIFLGSALRGDFGQSIKEGRPSMEVIVERVPATLQLGPGRVCVLGGRRCAPGHPVGGETRKLP